MCHEIVELPISDLESGAYLRRLHRAGQFGVVVAGRKAKVIIIRDSSSNAARQQDAGLVRVKLNWFYSLLPLICARPPVAEPCA